MLVSRKMQVDIRLARQTKGNTEMKKLLLISTLIIGAFALAGCDIGVLSLDIGMGFEEGSYVITE